MSLRCKPLLGTFIEITTNCDETTNKAFARIEEIHNLMSYFDQNSQVNLINNHAHKKPITIAPDLFKVISIAQNHFTNE